jgi:hypothetical protein
MKKIILATAALMLLSACNSKVKKTLGLTATPPDEFQVKSSKPLEVPPHYNLREPEAPTPDNG